MINRNCVIPCLTRDPVKFQRPKEPGPRVKHGETIKKKKTGQYECYFFIILILIIILIRSSSREILKK
jgi:hypothetical protein